MLENGWQIRVCAALVHWTGAEAMVLRKVKGNFMQALPYPPYSPPRLCEISFDLTSFFLRALPNSLTMTFR